MVELAFPLVVVIDVTVLTHTFGVLHAVRVWASRDGTVATKSMVAVITHPFGKVLRVDMGAAIDNTAFPALEDFSSGVNIFRNTVGSGYFLSQGGRTAIIEPSLIKELIIRVRFKLLIN